ncbi:MAG: hypothetical protein CMG32_01740 [Candidatus Marinimicrobia bacterium]|nr:hypothetical protein [Candidatus Neomarinimicrobiota bacterium]
MSALILAVSGLACFAIGYRFYSSFIERKIFSISEYQDKTPAEEKTPKILKKSAEIFLIDAINANS